MTGSWLVLALLGAAALFAASPAAAAPEGRKVPTETIILPSEDSDRPMPAIPADQAGADEAGPPEIASEPEGEAPIPVIEYDVEKLPPPVKRLREQIIEAAKSGDVARLRPIFDANGEVPQLSFDQSGEDPIAFLKSLSGDTEGREILAVLLEVLEAGYVHVDVGTPEEMYVWPYFARYPVDKLTPPQIVELFTLIFAGDYEDMLTYGTYLSFRVGIAPNGVWKFFLAGD